MTDSTQPQDTAGALPGAEQGMPRTGIGRVAARAVPAPLPERGSPPAPWRALPPAAPWRCPVLHAPEPRRSAP